MVIQCSSGEPEIRRFCMSPFFKTHAHSISLRRRPKSFFFHRPIFRLLTLDPGGPGMIIPMPTQLSDLLFPSMATWPELHLTGPFNQTCLQTHWYLATP